VWTNSSDEVRNFEELVLYGRFCNTLLELCVKSPSVSPPPPYPLFQWYLQSKKILLNLGMKCQNSAFNAQGWRVIIVLVQVRAVKICVAPSGVEALKKKGKRG